MAMVTTVTWGYSLNQMQLCFNRWVFLCPVQLSVSVLLSSFYDACKSSCCLVQNHLFPVQICIYMISKLSCQMMHIVQLSVSVLLSSYCHPPIKYIVCLLAYNAAQINWEINAAQESKSWILPSWSDWCDCILELSLP